MSLLPTAIDPQSLNNLAVIYTSQGRAGEATALLQAATQACPSYAEAWNNLGVLQRDIGAITDAIASYEHAARLAPDQQNAGEHTVLPGFYWCIPSHAYAKWLPSAAGPPPLGGLTDPPTALMSSNAKGLPNTFALTLSPAPHTLSLAHLHSLCAAQNRLLALNYTHPGEDPWVCEQHAAWGQDFQARFKQLPPVMPYHRRRVFQHGSGLSRPLRVGYVSPDLFTHSVSYFAEAPLSHNDPAVVVVFVYDSTPRRDAKSQRLRKQVEQAGGVWRCVDTLNDDQLAALVREDEIDILVELTGEGAQACTVLTGQHCSRGSSGV